MQSLFLRRMRSRTHKGTLKLHDWEEIEERLTVEGDRERRLVEEITQLSESAERQPSLRMQSMRSRWKYLLDSFHKSSDL